ncbi:MAG: HAMP domain-containing histidine kinase [Plectolyngbya sp. WJT66-NPBG17]|jgi:signal transduction histidine kinase|nr:HAMP domain-containing histidine kinase [Plectolyngbya sp. WJT66-NPBG17]MBW4524739.1 HAMP domain-containing histidine kinase [Phormidium tanganyikae FI6-MK23]
MRAVVPPVLLRPTSIVPDTIEPAIHPDSPIQSFCRLQIEQILSQLPGAGIRLVYQAPEQSKRQSFVYGREFWSILDPEAQSYLASESWWSKNSVGRLKKVLAGSQRRFYACPLSHTKPEYLLLGTTKLLTANQKRFIENAATLLNHHLSTVRELHVQRQTQQQTEYKNHQIAHQVKSPIALIQIYTEMLLSSVLEGQSRSYLELIQSSIQDINRHLKQLSVKQKPLRIEQHDLSEILAQSIKQLQPWLAEKQIQVAYSRSPILLNVDAWQLKQVFDNLISNAIHFSPGSGTIDCTWKVSQQEILIEVSDQGTGLSDADLEQVFTPFYSRRPEGTGLGLSIAQKIVQAHQGQIWVSNLPTGGAKFSFTLPRQQPKLSIVPAIEVPFLTSSL